MYIAICGPSGAGKDTAADMIANEFGYIHVSGGDVLREMLTALGLEPKKTALGPFGVFIRENYGLQPLFERVLKKAEGGKGVVISGIRSPDEAKLVKSQGGKVLYINASAEIRYARITARLRQSDVVSLEEFRRLDHREDSGVQGYEQNLAAIKAIADMVITNEGSINQLQKDLEAALNK